MKNILIVGASGHAKVIIDIIEKCNEYHIIGLIDTYKRMNGEIAGYPILGDETIIPDLMETYDIYGGIIAIGDNWTRSNMSKQIKSLVPEFKFLTAIHPNAVIGNNVKINEGTVVMAGAIVNSDSKIAEFCILNTKSSLGHDSTMGKFSSLAPNATIGGNVVIGNFSAVSIGATVIQNINIGIHTVIGAQALVLKDVGDYLVAHGTPAKEIKSREAGDSYLKNLE